jgi:hypothetical protein
MTDFSGLIWVVVGIGLVLAGVAFVYANLRGRKRRRTEADAQVTREQWGEEDVKP